MVQLNNPLEESMSWADNMQSMTDEAISIFMEKAPKTINVIKRSFGYLEAEITYYDIVINTVIKFGGFNMWTKHTHKENIDDRMYGRNISDYRFYKSIYDSQQMKSLNLDAILSDIYDHRDGHITAGSLGD